MIGGVSPVRMLCAEGEISRLSTLSSEQLAIRDSLASRIAELEQQLKAERAKPHQLVAEKNDIIRRIKAAFKRKDAEFDELMDIKIALAMEIKAYRAMLESEEHRIGITEPATKKRKRDSGVAVTATPSSAASSASSSASTPAPAPASASASSSAAAAAKAMDTKETGSGVDSVCAVRCGAVLRCVVRCWVAQGQGQMGKWKEGERGEASNICRERRTATERESVRA
jgi:hypothetical protein